MLLTFFLAQLILAMGMLAYLAWRRLFRVRRWLPFALGWSLIFLPLVASNAFNSFEAAIVILLITLGANVPPCAIAMFFFFLPDEPNRDTTVAFWTLWPLAVLCTVATFWFVAHFSVQISLSNRATYILFFAGFLSPHIAAFALWFYHRFRPRAPFS